MATTPEAYEFCIDPNLMGVMPYTLTEWPMQGLSVEPGGHKDFPLFFASTDPS